MRHQQINKNIYKSINSSIQSGGMYTNQSAPSRHAQTFNQGYSTALGYPTTQHSSSYNSKVQSDQHYHADMGYLQGCYQTQPLLYPFKNGNFDLLYSEEGDGEILVETLPPEEGGQLRLISCVDISTLYKDKRNKAIEIAKEYAKLQHPNILSMTSDFELLDNNGTLIFYTEAPDNIAGWKSYCKKKLTTDEMLCIFRQLCEALAYVHDQGLIHRDVHPTRIHSTFGLAKFNLIGMPYNYKKLLKKENFCGHVNYSAPELIQERFTFSAKVDIWSLGCCLYYLCTKKDPFEGRNPQEIKQNIMMGRLERYPSKFDLILKNLIHKCLEKDEAKRLSAREMLEFQDSLELETYGEIRSSIMLKQMMEDYMSISSNPMIHKQSSSGPHSNVDHLEKGNYGSEERYNNPHFFQNIRNPNYGQLAKIEPVGYPQGVFDTNISMMACQSPESMSLRDLSQGNQNHFHTLNNYSQIMKAPYSQKTQLGEANPDNQLEMCNYQSLANKKTTFQRDFKGYQTASGVDSSISKFARSTISQNFQNNLSQIYQRQQQESPKQNLMRAPPHQHGTKPNEQAIQQDQPLNQASRMQVAPPLNASQPNKASQPQKIVLPKQEYIQRQIKQYQDKVDPPLPHFKTEIDKQLITETYQGNQDQQRGTYQRYNLTQSNLSMFNSHNASAHATQAAPQQVSEPSNYQVQDPLNPYYDEQAPPSSKQPNNSTECKANDFSGDHDGLPNSIFNTECIFASPPPINNEGGSSVDDFNSDNIKDGAVMQQEDNPSSGESRNELNKDEIEGIVAQMVESSKRVKNQLNYFDGTKYVGEVMRHGRGIYYDQDGSIYDGEWYEDQRSGKGKILFSDGSVYDGQWEADKIHGKGVYLSSNGDRYEGYFNLGMKEGFGAMYYRSGNTYQGQWKADQLCGIGVFHFKNGNYYEGNFSNGNFEGQGLMFFVGIGTYKGSFSQGNLQGIGRFEYLNGSVYDGDWKENRKHGKGQLIESDGRTVFNGDWENDQKHGKGTFLQKSAYIIEGVWNRGSLIEMTKFKNYNQ